jgi:hypothetical protein
MSEHAGKPGADAAEDPVGRPHDPALGDPPDAYVIPRQLAQATLEYLAAQPYREVFALIRGFETLEPAP